MPWGACVHVLQCAYLYDSLTGLNFNTQRSGLCEEMLKKETRKDGRVRFLTSMFLWNISLDIVLLEFLTKFPYASIKLLTNPISVSKQKTRTHWWVKELVFPTSTLPGKKEIGNKHDEEERDEMHLSLPPFAPACLPAHSLRKEMEATLSIYCMRSCSSPAVSCLKELRVRLGLCGSRN